MNRCAANGMAFMGRPMDKRTIQAIVVVLIVAGLCVGLFFLFFEKAQRQIETFGSAEARRNPFLAASKFLDKAGIPASSSNQREFLNELPPVQDMILIHKPGSNYPEDRQDQIVAWVESGGTLVINNNFSGQNGYQLLERFGIFFQLPDSDKDTASKKDKREERHSDDDSKDKDECKCSEKETIDDIFYGKELALAFSSAKALPLLESSSHAMISFVGKYGAHILQKSVGDGQLIVLSDDRFLQNSMIGENDHAYFLLKLSENQEKVWILYNSIMPSLMTLVLTKMPYMVVSLGILIIFTFLFLTIRIGPLYPLNDYSNRNIIEHLLSAGHFVRKKDRSNQQIKKSRDTLEKKIATKYLYFPKKKRTEQIQLISKWAQMPVTDVLTALDLPVKTTSEYIKTTMLIKKIEDEIIANYK